VVTNLRHRTDARLPAWIGAIGRAIWPIALLLLFFAAFQQADPGDRVRAGDADSPRAVFGNAAGHAGTKLTGVAADTVADCEQPVRPTVDFLERCLAAQPDDVELMLDLGAAHESAGRWPDAERMYSRAARIDPRDGEAHLRLGRVHLALGDVAAARQDGEAALMTQPGNPEVLRLVKAGADKAGP
jgi:tetratricopeptide (TPR) repeat protein